MLANKRKSLRFNWRHFRNLSQPATPCLILTHIETRSLSPCSFSEELRLPAGQPLRDATGEDGRHLVHRLGQARGTPGVWKQGAEAASVTNRWNPKPAPIQVVGAAPSRSHDLDRGWLGI